jgi:hypothetical protein
VVVEAGENGKLSGLGSVNVPHSIAQLRAIILAIERRTSIRMSQHRIDRLGLGIVFASAVRSTLMSILMMLFQSVVPETSFRGVSSCSDHTGSQYLLLHIMTSVLSRKLWFETSSTPV